MMDRGTILRWIGVAMVLSLVTVSVATLYGRTVILQNYSIELNESIATADHTPRELIAADALACEWGQTTLGLFSSNVFSPLIYYSHLFPTITMCLLAFVMLRQGKNNKMAQLFIGIAMAFTVWCLLDLATWAENNPDLIMFFWASEIYLDPLIYVSAAYLFYLFAFERDISGKTKLLISVCLAPIVILAPSALNLAGFDYTNCDREAIEGPLWHYVYGLEVLICAWMVIYALRAVRLATTRSRKWQIAVLASGLGFFMLAFSWGNLVGTVTENWAVAQYGLFGMPIFLAVVMYLIIQYQAFEIRALATTALVISLGLMLGSVLLLPTMDAARPVIYVTLGLFGLMGYLLVGSVRKEIRLREKIQKQEESLELANAQQVSLINFISHEVKGALSKGQSAFGEIIEGDYGEVSPQMKTFAGSALVEMRKGIAMVMDILDASNLKKGTLSFKHDTFDMAALVSRVCDGLQPDALKRSLTLTCEVPLTQVLLIGDAEKMEKHVLRNLVDNAIKYTPQGEVHVTLVATAARMVVSVKDSGVGIDPEDYVRLFTEGGKGKDSATINVASTGYGLFIAKQVVEAHHGHIHAESAGKGQGSTFIVELPRA